MTLTTPVHGRSTLVLEGLWDQLEVALSSLQRIPEQPNEAALLHGRLQDCRRRLQELVEWSQSTQTMEFGSTLLTSLREIAELLECMQGDPDASWADILYQAQDVVLDALHATRAIRHSVSFFPAIVS